MNFYSVYSWHIHNCIYMYVGYVVLCDMLALYFLPMRVIVAFVGSSLWDVLFRIERRNYIFILKRIQKYDNSAISVFFNPWRLHCNSVRRCQFGFILLILVIHWFLRDLFNHRIPKVTRCHVHFVVYFYNCLIPRLTKNKFLRNSYIDALYITNENIYIYIYVCIWMYTLST